MGYVDTITATGQALTGKYKLWGFWLTCDGANDPTITIQDRDNTTGKVGATIMYANTFDASALGLNGATWHEPVFCNFGVYVTITVGGGGNCEVHLLYS